MLIFVNVSMIKTNYQVDSYKTNTLYYDANNVFFHLNDVERRNKPFLAVFSQVHFVHRANDPFDFQHFLPGRHVLSSVHFQTFRLRIRPVQRKPPKLHSRPVKSLKRKLDLLSISLLLTLR